MLHQVINIFLLLWVLVPQKGSMILLYVSFGTGTAPRLHQPLTASLLSLYPLPSLISNCVNLPFGTQGRSRGLNELLFPPSKKWWCRGGGDMERICAGTRRVPPCFTPAPTSLRLPGSPRGFRSASFPLLFLPGVCLLRC